MKIGNYDLKIFTMGYFALDGGAMFGIVPKPLWNKSNPADDSNRITLSTRGLLLTNNSRKIIIDTGMGDKWDEKSKNIYDIDQSEYSIDAQLKVHGLSRENITDVILTHLHFDHTGGSTIYENGKLVPAFPNARYYGQKKNFEWASSPSDRDRGSYIADNFMPLRESGVLSFFDGAKKFDDNIEFIVVNGHTFGQQLIKISDSSSTLLFCGDLLPTTSHIPLPYIMGYDLQPLVTLEEKKKILAKAADENWLLFFEHDPDTALATIKRTEKGFGVHKKFATFSDLKNDKS